MVTETARARLATEALALKKAFLLVATMATLPLKPSLTRIPDYAGWEGKRLKGHVADLESDVSRLVDTLANLRGARLRHESVQWLAVRYDRWKQSGFNVFTVATAQEFEFAIAVLRARSELDIPPYTELLLQPGGRLAYRHPEYSLSRDLNCLYSFYLDCERLLKPFDRSVGPPWTGAASENSQSLGRATIQACFNLLEAVVSGIARAHLMTRTSLSPEVKKVLNDTQKGLSERVQRVPEVVTGRPIDLGREDGPHSYLFKVTKKHRDAFVHCEPGPQESQRGYVKEVRFNAISPTLVLNTVNSTEAIVRALWGHVYDGSEPRWLALRPGEANSKHDNLMLVPPTAVNATVPTPRKDAGT